MGERERQCDPATLPATLAAAVKDYRWSRDLVGESGGAVYRLNGRAGAPDLFLKHGEGRFADDVTDEMVRLTWLADRLPVPGVRGFVRIDGDAWLLTEAITGRTAWQLLTDEPAARADVVDALARFLRRLHAIPVDSCPFEAGHALRLGLARARIDAGLVEEDEFDDARAGWNAGQVWDAMQALLPLSMDPVVTHGDYSLDNIILRDRDVVGCIDVGRAGRADRYQDLAILWNCLGEFDAGLQRRLFTAYGITEPDAARLDFYLMLDEMF